MPFLRNTSFLDPVMSYCPGVEGFLLVIFHGIAACVIPYLQQEP